MTFVVTEKCIRCKYTDCVEVCPVDCFYEGPNFLAINPDECIDCALCEPECPVNAIYSEDDLPEKYQQYIKLNAELSAVWPVITKIKPAPPDADKWADVEEKLEYLEKEWPKKVKLLALDTSSTACSVALFDTENKAVYSKHKTQSARQGQLILPVIEEILEEASVNLHQLDAIAYGQGPGSYTGSRIAASVIQGIACTLSCPLIPISSLAILAQGAYQKHGWKTLLVTVDARAGEVYWAQYEINKEEVAILTNREFVTSPDKIRLPQPETACYSVGDAWNIYEEKLTNHIGGSLLEVDNELLPNAKSMIALAVFHFARKNWVTPLQAFPIYLR